MSGILAPFKVRLNTKKLLSSTYNLTSGTFSTAIPFFFRFTQNYYSLSNEMPFKVHYDSFAIALKNYFSTVGAFLGTHTIL